MTTGDQVRILRTNEIGIITSIDLVKIHGQKHKRYEVRTKPKQEGWWYKAEQLGPVVEKVHVEIKGEQKGHLAFDLEWDHRPGKSFVVHVEGVPDINTHDGTFNAAVANMLMKGLTATLGKSVLTR
ncbi:MAG: hypothetical protein Q4D56_06585 [Bacteroides sp.]|nr:hypothetical protein [Bacteroides sp.]